MKLLLATALVAISFAFPGNANANNDVQVLPEFNSEIGLFYNPNICIRTARELIENACKQANVRFGRGWGFYRRGVNTITILPNGYRVRLKLPGGGFAIIDIIDDF